MKIYLNAGHGGADTGAVGVSVEKTETLKLAKSIRPILESAGHTVVMSRTDDSYDSVTSIAAKANAAGANLFVAIHLNAYNGTAKGTECLIVSGASATSKKMAEEINKRLAAIGFTNRGVKVQDTNTYVLSHTLMPATTVEVCFIDNQSDMALYNRKYNDIVSAIANGILVVATVSADTGQNIYTATRDSALIISAKGLPKGADVELLSYFEGDTFCRIAYNGIEGLSVFADIKKK